jgi:hypothetical protein
VNGTGGHYGEEDLILYYYGESDDAGGIDTHIARCDACAASYHRLRDTLREIPIPEVPRRDERYGLEVWQRIRTRLPERHPSWGPWGLLRGRPWRGPGLNSGRLQLAALAASLVLIGFAAGWWWRPTMVGPASPVAVTTAPPRATPSLPASIGGEAADDPRRRVLLLAVAEHFEESDRALTEFLNAAAGRDIEAEQQWADDLLSASRLYRRDALDADEASVAATLDDLERALLEIVHTPSLATRAQLDELDRRIDSAALLFKVRVMSDDLRRRERAASRGNQRNGSPNSKVS